MKGIVFLSGLISSLLTSGIVLPAAAQVTSDGTTNTTVNSTNNNFNILNGIQKGNNLFHSFKEFSIPTGGSATFDLTNTSNINTIFSRVTGGNISNIDGLIKVNGNANLFLMNPAGIVFGENARLDIGGSFIGTTANSIKFSDGAEFSALNSQKDTLLSINVPIGLQMGNNPLPIKVQGTGHTLDFNNKFVPLIRNSSPTKLQVQPGKTLALVGGNLNLQGATLHAEKGHIELGSVGNAGLVSLVPIIEGYKLEYENQQNFNDIQLAEKSLLDVSGFNAGSVQLQGRKIQLTDGSVILTANLGNLPGGDILLQASEAIEMIGTTSDTTIRSWIRSEALDVGNGASISIVTPQLLVEEGAGINTLTYGVANGGNIDIKAAGVEISGFSLLNPTTVTSISTSTRSNGTAGDIFVNGDSLAVSSGASLASVTFSSGSSGKVKISNHNTKLQGENPFGFYSSISLIAIATGDTKDLILDTDRLQISDGGSLGSSTFFVGNAGDVTINARESITISGASSNNNSSINSSAARLNPQLRQFFGLPDLLTANAGSVTVNTPNLTLTDGGTVSVTSQGTGNGGNLSITADTIKLKNQGLIQAATESGNGGDIGLQIGNLLLIRESSKITATAGGDGDGGNININSPVIAGFEDSDIVANAVLGSGGNINITTQGIFGLEFRDELTEKSDITASSQFGVNGTVEINNISIDPSSGLVELPVELTDSSQQVASGCSSNTDSSFVSTGRGGIPQNPNEQVNENVTWSDIRDLSVYRKPNSNNQITQLPNKPAIVEATGFIRNQDGEIELVASKPTAFTTKQISSCSASQT